MTDLPQSVDVVASAVNERLGRLFDDEQQRWDVVDPRLGEAVSHLRRMSQGGKRLRAAFCYWAWMGAAGESQHSTEGIIDAGAAFELLQTFALIHDDIMDDADTRRGEQTVHTREAERVVANQWRGEPRRYGDGVAILIGDLSHVYADRLIGGSSRQARHLWDELRIELNLGQYLDIRTAASGELDRAIAQRIATFKSALYTIVRPLQVGAALVVDDTNPALLDQLEAFGRPVGQAFQLRDDLLGVVGDARTLGKPVGSDIVEGKPTELVAVALERATPAQHEVLAGIGQPNLGAEDVTRIIEVLEETGAIREIEQRIDQLVDSAGQYAEGLAFDSSVRKTLIELARYVAARSH